MGVDLQLQGGQLGVLLAVLLFFQLDVQVGVVQKHHQDVVHDNVIFIIYLALGALDGAARLGILKHLQHQVDLVKAALGVDVCQKHNGVQRHNRHQQQRHQPFAQVFQDHGPVNGRYDVEIRVLVALPVQQAVPVIQLDPELVLLFRRVPCPAQRFAHQVLQLFRRACVPCLCQQTAAAVNQVQVLVIGRAQHGNYFLQVADVQGNGHTAFHRQHPGAHYQLPSLAGFACVHHHRGNAGALGIRHRGIHAVPAAVIIRRKVDQPAGRQRTVVPIYIDQNRIHVIIRVGHAVQ